MISVKRNRNLSQESQFVNVKTKKVSILTPMQKKVAALNLFARNPPEDQNITSFQQSILNLEIQKYHSNENSGAPRYPVGTKFYYEHHCWPYFKQLLEKDYSKPQITAEEHRQHVKQHLYNEWKKSYPAMPRLPLQVKVETYWEICNEIEKSVARK